MRSIPILVLMACTACNLSNRKGGSMPSLEADLRAIEALNQRDVQAALAGDADMMMSQWTDDFVVLPPVGPIMRGRAVIAKTMEGIENPMETVDWALKIEEVKIF